MQRLLHKHYINGVILSVDYIPKKSYHDLGLLAPNRYEVDLLNEVLNIHFNQGVAKISRLKDRG